MFYSPLPVCISTQVWEGLSAEDRQLLQDAAKEAAQAARSNNDATMDKMEEDLTVQGMVIVAEENIDTAAFQDAVKPCYEEMESYIGSEWVEKLLKLVQ